MILHFRKKDTFAPKKERSIFRTGLSRCSIECELGSNTLNGWLKNCRTTFPTNQKQTRSFGNISARDFPRLTPGARICFVF